MPPDRSLTAPRAAWQPLDPGGAVSLGRAIRDARRRRRIGQEQLAAELGVARNTVCQLELGRRPNVRLGLLAELPPVLGISLTELVYAYLGSIAGPLEEFMRPSLVMTAPAHVTQLGVLEMTGATGMGVTLRAFRTDLGASVCQTASRAGTHPRYVDAIEGGCVPSPGLLSITRLTHAIDTQDADLRRTTLRVRLLVQVYAAEITPFLALQEHRNLWRSQ